MVRGVNLQMTEVHRADKFKQHFLAHQRLWCTVLLLLWGALNVLVLTTTVLMDAASFGRPLPFWEPLCWELTSTTAILLLIWAMTIVLPRWIETKPWYQQALLHLLLTIPFSLVHVLAMMALRKLWYWLAGSLYQPFDAGWWYVLFYEFRKDFMSYFLILFVISGYRLMVLRLRGEATYVPTGEKSVPVEESPPQQLLVKKLGKEFLIHTADIEWVEAAGNYANLHVGAAVYPMRITMARLAELLPAPGFIRIHRSTIVSSRAVAHIEPLDTGDHRVTLKNGKVLSLSRRYREHFRDSLAVGSQART